MRHAPTLVVLAAGLGTRYGGLKQLDPVGPGDTAILDYTLADAARAGFGRAVLVVRPDIEGELRRHLDRTGGGGLPSTVVHQTPGTGLFPGASVPDGRTRPWGTTHAVLAAGPELDGPFAVANADDHYGPGAWACLGEWLRSGTAAPRPEGEPTPESGADRRGSADGALVTYRLADTLSDHGGVNRAVCEVGEDGLLVRIREALDVRRSAGGALAGEVGGRREGVDKDAPVSMNLWGFGPGFLPLARGAFERFLAEGPGPDEELHLPDVVGEAVAAGRLHVRALPCGDEWFGMTHRDDRPGVIRRLALRGPPLPPSPPA